MTTKDTRRFMFVWGSNKPFPLRVRLRVLFGGLPFVQLWKVAYEDERHRALILQEMSRDVCVLIGAMPPWAYFGKHLRCRHCWRHWLRGKRSGHFHHDMQEFMRKEYLKAVTGKDGT